MKEISSGFSNTLINDINDNERFNEIFNGIRRDAPICGRSGLNWPNIDSEDLKNLNNNSSESVRSLYQSKDQENSWEKAKNSEEKLLNNEEIKEKNISKKVTGNGNTNSRKKTTKLQANALEEAFKRNKKPSSVERKNLADEIGMCQRSVQIWFQNRRARSKLSNKNVENYDPEIGNYTSFKEKSQAGDCSNFNDICNIQRRAHENKYFKMCQNAYFDNREGLYNSTGSSNMTENYLKYSPFPVGNNKMHNPKNRYYSTQGNFILRNYSDYHLPQRPGTPRKIWDNPSKCMEEHAKREIQRSRSYCVGAKLNGPNFGINHLNYYNNFPVNMNDWKLENDNISLSSPKPEIYNNDDLDDPRYQSDESLPIIESKIPYQTSPTQNSLNYGTPSPHFRKSLFNNPGSDQGPQKYEYLRRRNISKNLMMAQQGTLIPCYNSNINSDFFIPNNYEPNHESYPEYQSPNFYNFG